MSTIEVVVAETACAGKVDELIKVPPDKKTSWGKRETV